MPFPQSNRDYIPTWKDQLGPAYSLGSGAAAPSMTVLTGSTHVRGLTFGPGDRVDVVVQFNHDVIGPVEGGNINFDPHVHYTFVDNPTAGDAVRWKFTYMGAAPSITGGNEFASSPSTISSSRHVLTSTEIRKHYIRTFEGQRISVSTAVYQHSYILWGTLELSTLSTIAAGKVALLAFDIHKPTRTRGSATEYA